MEKEKFDIVIWGIGYLGVSNMIRYSAVGIDVYGIDNNPRVFRDISAGTYKNDLLKNLGYSNDIYFNKKIHMGSRLEIFDFKTNNRVHLICVPTEKYGEPYRNCLDEVITSIIAYEANSEKVTVVIESTMIPGTAEELYNRLSKNINGEVRFAVAPRRDWFVNAELGCSMVRVFGTNHEKNNEFIEYLLSLTGDTLVTATSYKEAEMCKSVENAFRYIDIVFANQIAEAFPKINVREVLELAGTKWNIETYHPTFGPGGYCIPLAGKYILNSTMREEDISILQKAFEFDNIRISNIAKKILRNIEGDEKIVILGTAYTPNIGVDKSSPIVNMIKLFQKSGVQTYIHDPFFSQEIEKRYGGNYFNPYDLCEWEGVKTIILNTAHDCYKELDINKIIGKLGENARIYDNTGMWKALSYKKIRGVKYFLIGDISWWKER